MLMNFALVEIDASKPVSYILLEKLFEKQINLSSILSCNLNTLCNVNRLVKMNLGTCLQIY